MTLIRLHADYKDPAIWRWGVCEGIDLNENHKSKGGKETQARARVAAMTRTQVKNQAHNHSAASSQLNKCSNLKSNDPDACLRSLGILGCSMEAWCTAPCT